MTNKAPFCAFLWLTITVLSRLKTSMTSVANKQFVKIRVNSWLNFLCSLVPLWLKKPRNSGNLCQRYPLLIKDLRSTKDYVRKNKLFMQNKANFRKSQMNVSDLLIGEYEKMDTWSIRKNEPKTNPIQSQFKPNSKPISEAKKYSYERDFLFDTYT